MFTEKPDSMIVKPKALYTTHRKHVGYYCTKCETEKLLNVMRLCQCLDLEEDPKAVKRHINTFWAPTYAHMDIQPPRAPFSSSRR